MIYAVTLAIAASGAALLLILFARIRAVDAELKLKKHRSKDAGLADLLNYAAMVDDGVIVGKNGAFMAAWLYQGDDNASSTDEQREIVSFRLNQALCGLGNGWMVHVDAVRRPAANYSGRGASHFTDPVAAAIDEERRQLFESLGTMYEGYFVLTLTYFPPVLLPDGRGNVDHLVIGPNGLFVIETKNYSGYVKCWGDNWYVNGRKIGSLSKQAKRNAIAVKNTLEDIFAEHRTRLPFIHALLCFVNPRGRLNLKQPAIPVLRSSELVRFIGSYKSPRTPVKASADLTRAIVHHLHLLQQKPDKQVVNG